MAMESIKVLQVSESKKTFIINFGEHDGIKSGHVGRFYVRPDAKKGRLAKFVGQATAFKVYPSSSVWYLKASEIRNSKGDPKGDLKRDLMTKTEDDLPEGTEMGGPPVDLPLVMFIVSDFEKTKKEMDFKRKLVVLAAQDKLGPHSVDEVVDSEGRAQPASLVKNDQAYYPGEHPRPEIRASRRAGVPTEETTVDLGEWEDIASGKEFQGVSSTEEDANAEAKADISAKAKGPDQYVVTKRKGPTRQEWEKRKLSEDLEQRIAIYFQRDEDPDFNLVELYHDQEKDEDNQIFNRKSTAKTMRDMLEERRHNRLKAYKDAKSMIAREGPEWSDDMNDDQLRRFIHEKGLEHEKVRQTEATRTLVSHEVFFSYSFNMKEHSTGAVDESVGSAYGLSLGYEFYGMQIADKWDHFSLKASIKKSQDVYSSDEINGLSSEFSFLFGGSFYPFQLPAEMRVPLFYLGAGLRWGKSDYTVSTSTSAIVKYYNLYSMPSLWTGLKFRWNDDFGLHGEFQVEMLHFKSDIPQELAGAPQLMDLTDYKLHIGINYYF